MYFQRHFQDPLFYIHANLNDFFNSIKNFISSRFFPLFSRMKKNFIRDFVWKFIVTVFFAFFLHNLPNKITGEAFYSWNLLRWHGFKTHFAFFLLSSAIFTHPHSHVSSMKEKIQIELFFRIFRETDLDGRVNTRRKILAEFLIVQTFLIVARAINQAFFPAALKAFDVSRRGFLIAMNRK